MRRSEGREMEKAKKRRPRSGLFQDDDNLNYICERANYLSYCQMHFEFSEHPSPLGNGWELINGKYIISITRISNKRKKAMR